MRINEDEIDSLRLEDQACKRYQYALMQNPDCRDPDHPGCDLCEENEDDE